MKIVVYAPGDYTPNGGGCVALHKLANNIASLGEDCYIMTSKKNPDYLATQVNEAEAIEICKNDDALAIYPEVTCGNPFNAKHCMRWILYFVREYDCHGIFGADDLIYKYAPHFTLRYPQHVHGELRAVELNLNIFTDRKQERGGSCFLIKKENNKEQIHPADAIQLDDYASRGGNEYLADVFNRCEIFYSYDTATWLSIMAVQCGCISVVVPNTGVNPLDWYAGYPYFKYGIAYGLSEVAHAQATAHLVRENLLQLERETLEQTKEFIRAAYDKINYR